MVRRCAKSVMYANPAFGWLYALLPRKSGAGNGGRVLAAMVMAWQAGGMSEYLFPPAPPAALPVSGQEARFPVNRIFCVGRNYAAHAAEMGAEVDRDAPF